MTVKTNSELRPREFFSKLNVRPSKTLGQNFITDMRIIDRILEAARIAPGDEVLEIGAGLGALTFALAGQAERVVTIERDEKLAAALKGPLEKFPNVELVPGDALKIDFREFYRQRRLKVISNLPYSVSSPILIKLLRDREIFSSLVLMLQLEVGERITSLPGGKEYGSLSVLIQAYFDVKSLFRVPAQAFWPVPKVDSVVIEFLPLGSPRVSIPDDELFEKVLRASFSSRRKMIGNSLASILGKEAADRALSSAGIDRGRRAETLTVAEFGALTRQVFPLTGRAGLPESA